MIQADALNLGDGGRVIVWADEINRFWGNVSATGGIDGGNGGFVETKTGNITLTGTGGGGTNRNYGISLTAILLQALNVKNCNKNWSCA